MHSIKKISILGVGIMGGSLARAIKDVFPDILICGYARSVESYEKLKKVKFLDNVECDLKAAVHDADCVVLGVPIFVMEKYLAAIAPLLKPGAIVLDLGSTKEMVEKAAKKYLPKNISFVGCHPICGSEKTGAENVIDDLYRDALCIITALRKNHGTKTVAEFWRSLGMRVKFMKAKDHDRMLAQTSHLPHAVSFSLANSIEGDYLKFAPPSLRDMTRIAGSPSSVWVDIFFSNKANTLAAVRRYAKALKQFEIALVKDNKAEAAKFIEKANRHSAIVRGK